MIEYDSFVALMVDKAEEQALEAAMGALGDAQSEEEDEAAAGEYGGGEGGMGGAGGMGWRRMDIQVPASIQLMFHKPNFGNR